MAVNVKSINIAEVSNSMISNAEAEKLYRKEYSRVRAIARKRLQRLAEAGYSDNAIYRNFKDEFPALKDIKNRRELAYRLVGANRFIARQDTTLKGLREIRNRAIESLRENGYDFVNTKNYDTFVDVMSRLHEQRYELLYRAGKTEQIVTELSKKKKINAEVIEKTLQKHLKESKKNISAAKLKRRKIEAERQRKAALAKGEKPVRKSKPVKKKNPKKRRR